MNQFKDDPFVLLGVNSDEDVPLAKKATKKHDLTWRSWHDGTTAGPISKLWNVTGWPTVVLVDRKGSIRYRSTGLDPELVSLAIERLLDEE